MRLIVILHIIYYIFFIFVEKKTYRRESDEDATRNTNSDFRFKVLPFVSKFFGEILLVDALICCL